MKQETIQWLAGPQPNGDLSELLGLQAKFLSATPPVLADEGQAFIESGFQEVGALPDWVLEAFDLDPDVGTRLQTQAATYMVVETPPRFLGRAMVCNVEDNVYLVVPWLLGAGFFVEGDIYPANDRQTEAEFSQRAGYASFDGGNVDLVKSADWCLKTRKNDRDEDAAVATLLCVVFSACRDLVSEPPTRVSHTVRT